MGKGIKINIIGRTFGKLLAVSEVGRATNDKNPIYSCVCECGKIKEIRKQSLLSGHTKSCGCLYRGKPTTDVIGKRFGRLVVLRQSGKDSYNNVKYLCECDCGKETIVYGHVLRRRKGTKSCGCLSVEKVRESMTTHGQAKHDKPTPEYKAWQQLKHRCSSIKNKNYFNYGGRGIKVCDRWINSFENFYADMGNRPSKNHSIERGDNDLGYNPENCYWGTTEQQSRNKRNNHWIEYNGRKMIIGDWARELNIVGSTIRRRLKMGQSFEFIYNHFKKI